MRRHEIRTPKCDRGTFAWQTLDGVNHQYTAPRAVRWFARNWPPLFVAAALAVVVFLMWRTW